MRIIKADVAKAKAIVSNPNIPVLDKLFRVLMEQSPKSGDVKDKMIEQFHQPNNAGNASKKYSTINYSFISCFSRDFRTRNR